jgi:hypothetical protein
MGRRIPDATSSMLPVCSALKFLTVRATYIDSYEPQSEHATRRNPMAGFLKHAEIGSVREHGMELCSGQINITRIYILSPTNFFRKRRYFVSKGKEETVATWNIDC